MVYCGVVVVKVEEEALEQEVRLLEASILVKGYPTQEAKVDMDGKLD